LRCNGSINIRPASSSPGVVPKTVAAYYLFTYNMPEFKERELITDPQKVFHYTDLQRLKPTRANDPYEYQHGWGNRHQSEVIPGTLPVAQNNPHEVRFGLYTEGITYSAFAAPRAHNFSTYMYRCRPAAAHSKKIFTIGS
jgi:homogentisate 1,2-dioxygenase